MAAWLTEEARIRGYPIAENTALDPVKAAFNEVRKNRSVTAGRRPPPVSLLQRLCKRHGIVHLSGSIPPKVSQSSAKSPQTSRPATAYRAEVPLASPAWIEAGMTYEI